MRHERCIAREHVCTRSHQVTLGSGTVGAGVFIDVAAAANDMVFRNVVFRGNAALTLGADGIAVAGQRNSRALFDDCLFEG